MNDAEADHAEEGNAAGNAEADSTEADAAGVPAEVIAVTATTSSTNAADDFAHRGKDPQSMTVHIQNARCPMRTEESHSCSWWVCVRIRISLRPG